MPSQPQAIMPNNNHVMYNHLDRKGSIQTTNSSVFEGSYDRLDRTGSLNDRMSLDRSYSRLNNTIIGRSQSERSRREQNIHNSYDHLERSPSFGESPTDVRSRSFGSLEGRSRFHLPSPPPEDSYNHLNRYRHASLPSSCSPRKEYDFYNKLDRSVSSVYRGTDMTSYDRLDSMQDVKGSQMSSYDRLDSMQDVKGSQMSSYDRLGSMQGSVMLDKDMGMGPPPVSSKVCILSKIL